LLHRTTPDQTNAGKATSLKDNQPNLTEATMRAILTTLTNAALTSSSILRDRRGATAIEYGLIAAGISIAIATVVGTVGGSLETMFNTVSGSL
jgi:pilus assembly protein Flp/PilA